MSSTFSLGAFGLILASALGYATATIGMKLGIVSPSAFTGALILGCLAMAVVAEMAFFGIWTLAACTSRLSRQKRLRF